MTWSRAATTHIPNFRDVGGHATADGRRVRNGLLYRSVDLSGLDDSAMDWLAGLGLRTVMDLRTAPERARRPSRAPGGARVVVLDVLGDSKQADPAAFYELMQDPPRASAELAEGASECLLTESYRDFVRLPGARAAFGELIGRLAEDATCPALVHCTTGKDRTGWAVALLLLALGVPIETVTADYLRSDAEIHAAFGFIVDDFEARGGDRRVIEPILSARSTYLEAGLEEVRQRYGTLALFLSDGLGLDDATLAALRTAFLGPDDSEPVA